MRAWLRRADPLLPGEMRRRGARWQAAETCVANTLDTGRSADERACMPDAPLAKYARAWLLQDGTIEGLCNRINAVHAADRLGGRVAVLALLGVDHMAPLPRNWRQHGGRRVLQWFTP